MGRRSGGKDFDKIIHYYEPWIENKRHKVGVKLRTKDGQTLEFYTDHFKEDDQRTVVKNGFSSLADLYEWIEERLSTLPDVVWEPKIFIEVRGWSKGRVEGHHTYRGEGLLSAEVEIIAQAIEIGTASDGKLWSRAPGKPKSLSKFDANIGYGLEKSKWDQSDGDGTPYSRALIDDTPENRELLVQFAVKFDDLRDQFFRAFAPEYVYRFLSQTAGTLLLVAPNDSK